MPLLLFLSVESVLLTLKELLLISSHKNIQITKDPSYIYQMPRAGIVGGTGLVVSMNFLRNFQTLSLGEMKGYAKLTI